MERETIDSPVIKTYYTEPLVIYCQHFPFRGQFGVYNKYNKHSTPLP